MTTTRVRAAIALLLLFTLCIAAPSARAQGDGQIKRDIEYAKVGDIPLHLDLYLPAKANDRTQLIVWIHGGGWRQGSKDRCPIAWLTLHNYAVASVQYRLTDKAIFPAQIHDCKGAIRWLRAHAKEYGYHADRIGVAGISAGGHLVALLGTGGDVKALEGDVGGNLDQSSRVQAVLDMCGPTDFLLRLKENPNAVEPKNSPVALLLGGPTSEKKELAALASPATHVTKDDPPLMIFQGEKDPLVNPRQSKHLAELYKKAELDVTIDIIPDGGHVPKEFFDAKHREMAVEFFNKHIKAPAK